MKENKMREIFTTPVSEHAQRLSKERAEFEKWFETVANKCTGWNGSVPVSMWEFSRDEVNTAHLMWLAWLARSEVIIP